MIRLILLASLAITIATACYPRQTIAAILALWVGTFVVVRVAEWRVRPKLPRAWLR